MRKSSDLLKRGFINSGLNLLTKELFDPFFRKRHKFVSSTNIEYYFYGDFYVRIQEGATFRLPDYALITTTIPNYAQREYDFFKDKGLLEEITADDFNLALNRAINIINKLIDEVQ